jgi:hypothetical protein
VATLGMSLMRLKRELGVEVTHLDFYTLAPEVTRDHVVSEVWGHACEIEVSMSMYLSAFSPRYLRRWLPSHAAAARR